ncbi:MAG: aminodeoxychorismate lyase [Magnetovibrio sp.]|nr:aminodeoxychorismate lyase [Magnetovibrio sp.]
MRRVLWGAGVTSISVAGLISILTVGAYLWLENKFGATGPLQTSRQVIITKGAGLNSVARALESAGVIENARVFVFGFKLFATKKPIRAGEFQFPAAISPLGAATILQSGKMVARRLTIPEGLTRREVKELILTAPGLVGGLGPLPKEGWILPETYYYNLGDKRSHILTRMETGMHSLLSRLWVARDQDLPIKSKSEALALASIVEKETGLARERSRVAGVFINRLRRGMRLQSDPTVSYGITLGGRSLGRPLTRADLRKPSDFNTYVIKGLPPAAISNPGEASLRAVLQPMKTNELYFVANGFGGHAFAQTLAQHNINVAKWRRIQRQKKTK